MATVKRIVIDTNKCFLCGLCEDRKVGMFFERGRDGKIHVLNNGLCDPEKHPAVVEVINMCPGNALKFEDEATLQGDSAQVLQKLNDLIYKKLRDYPFDPPEADEYAYETGTYKVGQLPAQYRSSAKYISEYSAKSAGFSEFKRVVWSQHKHIASQYITAYKTRKLKRFFTNDKSPGNYIYDKNQEIQSLLQQVYDLAQIATNHKIVLPDDFPRFEVSIDWKTEGKYSLDDFDKLEDYDFDYVNSGAIYNADWYLSWIETDGDSKYYYDFSEAEQELRDDMDNAVETAICEHVKIIVDLATKLYLDKAKNILNAKLDLLQIELKKHIKVDSAEMFLREIEDVCYQISNWTMPRVTASNINIDTDYNGDYRFFSERSCETASENRRERAYKEGRYMIRQLPYKLNDAYMGQLQKIMTEWKRLVLQAYDCAGKEHPKTSIRVNIGNQFVDISFSNFNDVFQSGDGTIEKIVDHDILHSGTCAGSKAYINESDCHISIHEDFDVRIGLFGHVYETNRRWCYLVELFKFSSSVYDVASACSDLLVENDEQKKYFQSIKDSFIRELRKMAGV